MEVVTEGVVVDETNGLSGGLVESLSVVVIDERVCDLVGDEFIGSSSDEVADSILCLI